MEVDPTTDGMDALADLANVVKEAAEGTTDRETLRALARKVLDKHAATLAIIARIAAEFHTREFAGAMAPGYWMSEQSGALRPVVEKYINGGELDPKECATMRAYCRQWIMADGFKGEDVQALRREVHTLTTHAAIRAWMEKAVAANVDPL